MNKMRASQAGALVKAQTICQKGFYENPEMQKNLGQKKQTGDFRLPLLS